jgi:chromosome segregation ATPase
MNETNAIRPELRGLFDTVKQQARQYRTAFETIEKRSDEFLKLAHELRKLSDDTQQDVENTIYNLRQKVEDLIKVLELETEKTLQKYRQLKDISELKDNVEDAFERSMELRESLAKNNITAQNLIKSLDSEKDKLREIARNSSEYLVKQEKQLIDDTLRKNFETFDKKYLEHAKSNEQRIIKLDKTFWSLQDKYENEFDKMAEELAEMRQIFGSIKVDTDKRIDDFTKAFDLITKKIIQKDNEAANMLTRVEDLIAKLNRQSVKNHENDDSKLQSEVRMVISDEYEGEINALKRRIEAVAAKNEQKKDNKTPLYLAVTSIIINLILALYIIFF